MTVACVLTYRTHVEYNFPLLWLRVTWRYTHRVSVCEHKKVTSSRFTVFAVHPFPPFPFISSRELLFSSPTPLCVSIHISERIFGLWFWGLLISLTMMVSSSCRPREKPGPIWGQTLSGDVNEWPLGAFQQKELSQPSKTQFSDMLVESLVVFWTC